MIDRTDRAGELLDRKTAEFTLDSTSLVAFRVFFGLTIAVAAARFFAHDWVKTYWITPKYFFPYEGLEFIRPLGQGMYALYGVLLLSGLFVAIGLFYRVSITILFATFTWAHLADKTNYLNHYYFVSVVSFLMIFLPLADCYSVDSRRNGHFDKAIPTWVLPSLRLQVAIVYIFAGIAKIESDWLFRAQPLRIWLTANTEVPILGSLFSQRWVAFAMSWGGMFFDLLAPFFLLHERLRRATFLVLVGFHLLTAKLFQIGLFPYLMIGNALLFFPPNWPITLYQRLRNRVPSLDEYAGERQSVTTLQALPKSGWTKVFLILFFVPQVLVPFRSAFYAGSVLWHEQGFRFSYRVMLIEKAGVADFTIVNRSDRSSRTIDLRDYLTDYQIKMMTTQPDMLAQFAHHLRELEEREGRDVEVHAEVWVALNGRPAAPLVDTAVDLSRAPLDCSEKRWIMPLPDR